MRTEAYIVMAHAHIVTAYIAMAYIVMAYLVMAHIVIVLAYIGMAYIVMAITAGGDGGLRPLFDVGAAARQEKAPAHNGRICRAVGNLPPYFFMAYIVMAYIVIWPI